MVVYSPNAAFFLGNSSQAASQDFGTGQVPAREHANISVIPRTNAVGLDSFRDSLIETEACWSMLVLEDVNSAIYILKGRQSQINIGVLRLYL